MKDVISSRYRICFENEIDDSVSRLARVDRHAERIEGRDAALMRAVRRKRTTLVLGFTTGLLLGLLLFGRRGCFESAKEALRDLPPKEDPLGLVSLPSGPPPRRLLLFAGVMTAAKYLPTRAAAVHGTWGKKVPGRMAFFSGRDSRRPDDAPDLPLVALPSTDDSYPPQKKSFLMLDYMYTNYIDHFEWFLRADDDVYIRTDKLEAFLRSVDSRKPFFIGQAGRGNQEEFGRLSLEYDENFCMGGPGVILSRETLSRVAPHVRYCLANLYTTHEDVELGRCVQKFAGVSCTWSYEVRHQL